MTSSSGWAEKDLLLLQLQGFRQSEIISQPYSSPDPLVRKLGSSQNSSKCCPSVLHMDVTLAEQAWTCCHQAVQAQCSSPFLL